MRSLAHQAVPPFTPSARQQLMYYSRNRREVFVAKFNPFRPGSIVTPGMFAGRFTELEGTERALTVPFFCIRVYEVAEAAVFVTGTTLAAATKSHECILLFLRFHKACSHEIGAR
jgi:hypothetical protein